MKRYLKILYSLFKFSQVNFLEYRADFFLTWVGDILAVSSILVFFSVIYGRVNYISGWSQGEIYLLLAVVSYIEALVYFLYTESIRSVSRLLPLGDLDYSLTKPVDFQFLITFSKISPNTLGPIVPAIALTMVGIGLLRPQSLILKVFMYFYFIFLGLIVHYSIVLIITSYSFIAVRFHGVMHLDGRLRDLAQNPMDIFPRPLKLIFFTLIPVAFFGHLPVEVFRSSFSFWLPLYATAFAALCLYVSRRIFYSCLRRYSSASS